MGSYAWCPGNPLCREEPCCSLRLDTVCLCCVLTGSLASCWVWIPQCLQISVCLFEMPLTIPDAEDSARFTKWVRVPYKTSNRNTSPPRRTVLLRPSRPCQPSRPCPQPPAPCPGPRTGRRKRPSCLLSNSSSLIHLSSPDSSRYLMRDEMRERDLVFCWIAG